MAARTEVDVGARRLRIANLDRVVFPCTGTTKGEVLDCYVRVAGALVFEMGAVLERLADHGDLFAPVLTDGRPLRLGSAP